MSARRGFGAAALLSVMAACGACGKKPEDVAGDWEIEIDKTVDSIANDPADLALDSRRGDRSNIVEARKKELRPSLAQSQLQLAFRPDGKVVFSTLKNGAREAEPPQDWHLVDGKVAIGNGWHTLAFDGALLKGPLFAGHPGAAYLRKR